MEYLCQDPSIYDYGSHVQVQQMVLPSSNVGITSSFVRPAPSLPLVALYNDVMYNIRLLLTRGETQVPVRFTMEQCQNLRMTTHTLSRNFMACKIAGGQRLHTYSTDKSAARRRNIHPLTFVKYTAIGDSSVVVGLLNPLKNKA